jgi:hypothetical protein
MLEGVNLTLMIGVGVPTPASQDVIEALDAVQVTNSTQNSGFQLTFKIGKTSSLQTLIATGFFDPILTRVIILVTLNGLSNVIMDGVVTRQELTPSNEIGKSTFTITGEDLSRMMDLIEMPFMRWPIPVIGRVYAILARYSVLGIAPIAIPPIIPDVPDPLEELPSQIGTDLQYLRKLASDAGYVFFVDPGPLPGQSVAYFGPDFRVPAPQSALNVDMDLATNVEGLSFAFDGLAKKIIVVTIFDPVTMKIPIPIPVPNLDPLRPPMGVRLPVPSKLEFAEGMGAMGITDALNRTIGIMFGANDSITGTGTLDVFRYGQILRSRMMVGVRGAGLAYDGLYYVNSVTHNIKPGQYKQSFSISRDGLVANTPGVPT